MGLTLTRKRGQSIVITVPPSIEAHIITITPQGINSSGHQIQINAPKKCLIDRVENKQLDLFDKKPKQRDLFEENHAKR